MPDFVSVPLAALPADSVAMGQGEESDNHLECWLDTAADALCESGWSQQSILPLLPANLIEKLQQEARTLHQANTMQCAGVGRGAEHNHDRAIRRDKIAWMTGVTGPQEVLFRLFDQILQGLNRRLFCGLRSVEAHYATYEPGDFYRRHLDSFRNRRLRVVSLVLYLNNDWQPADGGELQIYSRENARKLCRSIKPEAGQLALFLSEEISHEVLPANRTRYSIACWFRTDAITGLRL